MESKTLVRSLEEMKDFWKNLLGQIGGRCVLLLEGEVGSGKTTSVQFITQILNMNGVQSPSFAIHQRYQNSNGVFLDHLDMYRLESEDELESTGFWDLFSQNLGLIVIEWSDRLNYEQIPINWQRIIVRIELGPDGFRTITVAQI